MRSRTHGAGRLTELDSLRGFAAVWVMIFHFSFGAAHTVYPDRPEVISRVAPFVVNVEGLLAVHLFFLISGFVIFMTLDKCATVKDFAVLRFGRLFPAYWTCLALTCAVLLLTPMAHPLVTPHTVAGNATMLQAFLAIPNIDSVYWSLPYELSFYVMIGVLFHLRLTERIELIGAVWLLVCFLAFDAFPVIGDHIPWRVRVAAGFPYTPLFLAGIVLFRIYDRGVTSARIALCVACYATVVWIDPIRFFWIHTAIFVVFPLAVFGWLPMLKWRPLVFLGAISYPLYLLHNEIGIRVQWALVVAGCNPWIAFLAAICVAIALATLVHLKVETPARRRIREEFRSVPRPVALPLATERK
jgi:peptidoglycan/LPS O-acetylase OafA/YrhL